MTKEDDSQKLTCRTRSSGSRVVAYKRIKTSPLDSTCLPDHESPAQETARLIRNDPSRPTASELKDILEDRFTPNAILMSEDSQESRTGATQTAEIGVHMVTGIPIRTRKVTQQPSSPNIQEDSRAAEASAMHDRAPLNRNTEIKLVHPLPFDELSADSSKRRKIEETKIMG